MYFTTSGTVAPCWLTVDTKEIWSKNNSISDIWFGDKFQKLRNDLSNNIFEGPCKICKKNIDDNVWSLSKAYEPYSVTKYPTMMELELSNQCNLECIMCNGKLSSGIRKNRDKLPPMPMMYDDTFIKQLEEFIPHLEELRFNGGEPFAQKIVFEICETVSILKPDLKINIATNGTVYNNRVEQLLDNCKVYLNISIDSLIKERYEAIRINGDFDLLMKNFEIFLEYTNKQNHTKDRMEVVPCGLCIMVNPMRNNWDEMINYVRWCDEKKVDLWYNTIRYPEHLSIWNLPTAELKYIIETLKTELNLLPKDILNYDKADHLINNQFSNWLLESYDL
jgi:organic radical activating enzyme